jgi:hypothetical protein
MNPQDRWCDLSKVYAEYHSSLRESNRRAEGLAKALRVQLQNYLGGGDISLFEYDEDSASKYVQQKDPFRAVTLNWTSYQWVVGYGVTLEQDPEFLPKTTFQFPVFFLIGDTDVTVDTAFGKIVLMRDDGDLTPACSLIYEGVRGALVARMNKEPLIDKRIGFIDFEPKG